MIQEDKRKEITKEKYRLIVWCCIIGGVLGVSGTCGYGMMNGFTYNLGLIISGFTTVIGYEGGLAMSRSYKIKDYDK